MDDPESAARASLFRSLLIYLIFLVLAVAVVVYVTANRASGAAFVTISIVGVVALLLAYQVVQHYRDMQSPLAETDGAVVRKWQRADLIVVMQSFYLTVDRTVFRVPPEDWVHIDEGMYVKVVHFPRTLTVVSIHEIVRPAAPPLDEP